MVGHVQPQDRAVVLGQHLGVAAGLGGDELPEGEVPTGNGEVLLGSSRDLEVDALRRAALVELPRRVQKARPPAERHGTAGARREQAPDARELRQRHPVDVCLHRDVPVAADAAQERHDRVV